MTPLVILLGLSLVISVALSLLWGWLSWTLQQERKQVQAERDENRALVKIERDVVLAQSLRFVESQAQIDRVLADVEAAEQWLSEQTLTVLSLAPKGKSKERMH